MQRADKRGGPPGAAEAPPQDLRSAGRVCLDLGILKGGRGARAASPALEPRCFAGVAGNPWRGEAVRVHPRLLPCAGPQPPKEGATSPKREFAFRAQRDSAVISELFPEEAASRSRGGRRRGEEGRLTRPRLTPSRLLPGTPSSKVFLEIDNRQCVQDSDQCFKSTDAAAALLASHAIQGTLSYPLVSVVSEWTGIGGGGRRPGAKGEGPAPPRSARRAEAGRRVSRAACIACLPALQVRSWLPDTRSCCTCSPWPWSSSCSSCCWG